MKDINHVTNISVMGKGRIYNSILTENQKASNNK